MAKTEKGKLVRGVVKPATPAGFTELIEIANDAAHAGFMLVGVVPVGTKNIGGVLVTRRPNPTANLVD